MSIQGQVNSRTLTLHYLKGLNPEGWGEGSLIQRMKALLSLKSAISQSSALAIIALTAIAPMAFPLLAAAAQTSGQSAVVFPINSNLQNQSTLNYNQLANQDPLVQNLNQYLADKQSPLAGSASQIIGYTNWKRALSISLVESNMCRFTPKYSLKGKITDSYNCSGIGGDSFKRYASYMDWFADMDNLLSQPNYVNRPIEKFIGYYVVPGSANWKWGVKKTEAELTAMESDANQQRLTMQTNLQLAYLNPPANSGN